MDFMADELFDGQRSRLLTIVNSFPRESMQIDAGQHFKGRNVVRVLNRIVAWYGLPQIIRVDNGPEFIS